MSNNKSFVNQIFDGLKLVFSSFGYISSHRLSFVYIWIAVILVLLFTGGVAFTSWLDGVVEEYVTRWLACDWMPEFMLSVASWLASILTWLLSLVIVFMFSGSALLIIMSPVFSVVAERSMNQLTGRTVESGWNAMVYGILRGVMISLRNLLMQSVIILALFVLSFVPVVGIVCPFLMFFVHAFYFGFSMADYSMEYYGKNVGESVSYARSNMGSMIGIGMLYELSLLIPFLGIYVAAVSAPSCVVASARLLADDYNGEQH